MRALRWLVTPALAIFVVLATFSGYRAVWQIRRLDLYASHDALALGDTVGVELVSWGRTEARGQLELIQGTVAETLVVLQLPRNRNASLDPRPQYATSMIALTPSILARFTPGPALLRATGVGSRQWLRTPPPTIRTRSVRLTGS